MICGCGRLVPQARENIARLSGKRLICTVCGAKSYPLPLIPGRTRCPVCGILRCPDGCCCGC